PPPPCWTGSAPTAATTSSPPSTRTTAPPRPSPPNSACTAPARPPPTRRTSGARGGGGRKRVERSSSIEWWRVGAGGRWVGHNRRARTDRRRSSDMREVWPGDPYPLGATWDGTGTNFALFSEVARRVELCLFDEAGRETRQELPEVDGFVWHGYLPGVGPGQR